MDAEKLTGGKPRRVGDGTPGPGRKKGVPNKATTEFRETVQRLLDENRENVSRWLTLVAEGDGSEKGQPDPGRALDLLAKLAEYAAPKLARTVVAGDLEAPQRVEFGWAGRSES